MINASLHQVAELVKDIESSYIWEKFLVVNCQCLCIIILSWFFRKLAASECFQLQSPV